MTAAEVSELYEAATAYVAFFECGSVFYALPYGLNVAIPEGMTPAEALREAVLTGVELPEFDYPGVEDGVCY